MTTRQQYRAEGRCYICGAVRDCASVSRCSRCLVRDREWKRIRAGHGAWHEGGPGMKPLVPDGVYQKKPTRKQLRLTSRVPCSRYEACGNEASVSMIVSGHTVQLCAKCHNEMRMNRTEVKL